MTIFLSILFLIVLGIAALAWYRRSEAQKEIAQFSITPDELHELIKPKGMKPGPVFVLDVRQPLDVLADPHIIPGSVRLAPKEVIANPKLIPADRDVVFYCTCPSDGTSRIALHHAREANFTRVKYLRGGLGAWKQKGFPVENYDTAFKLDTL